MIHFVPPHIEKVRAKIPELIPQVDVILGNLEDAIPADMKLEARRGFIALAKANEFGGTGLWTRINALNSPWVLDDLMEIVGEVGDKLDVVMLPKVDGPWDIHYIDQLLAQLEARHGWRSRSSSTRSWRPRGREERGGHRLRLSSPPRHEPRPRGPRCLPRG
jgi:malyl-CoA/(S)-citramalyl-CoA lyase